MTSTNEILELMSNSILRSIADEVRRRKLFAVLVDETADICRREQLCITVRTVREDFEAEEMVLGLYALDQCDAQTITNSILDVFRRLVLKVQDLRGQCYDGAAVMSGAKAGVAAKILELEDRALFTHCKMHSLNLAVQDCVCTVPALRDFLHFVQELITFLRDSPKRCSTVKQVAESVECAQTNIRPLCPTRFTLRFRALDGVKNQLRILPDVLDQIGNTSSDFKVKSTVSGFQRQLCQFEFYFCLTVSLKIFEKTDVLSKELQKMQVSCGEAISMTSVVRQDFLKMRNEDFFRTLWSDSLKLAVRMNADEPRVPRLRRSSPARYDEGAPQEEITAEQHYRRIFYECMDLICERLRVRIEDRVLSCS